MRKLLLRSLPKRRKDSPGVNSESQNGVRGPSPHAPRNNWEIKPKQKKCPEMLCLCAPNWSNCGAQTPSNNTLHGLIFRFIFVNKLIHLAQLPTLQGDQDDVRNTNKNCRDSSKRWWDQYYYHYDCSSARRNGAH